MTAVIPDRQITEYLSEKAETAKKQLRNKKEAVKK